MIRRLAPHVRTALITGETGTGKELVARALHRTGPRRDRRFVTVNCSAVVETLFESELFGHVRGAFTGATDNKPGLFEAADGGTLFLDEIGELPLDACRPSCCASSSSAKCTASVRSSRAGSTCTSSPRPTATCAPKSPAGRFRSDLYYRLNIVEVKLPPLRERREDIPYLTAAFVRDDVRAAAASRSIGLTPGAERLLAAGAVGRQRPRAAQRDRARLHPGRRRLHHRARAGGQPAVTCQSRRAARRSGLAPCGDAAGAARPTCSSMSSASTSSGRWRGRRQQESGRPDARPQPAGAVSTPRTAGSRRLDQRAGAKSR